MSNFSNMTMEEIANHQDDNGDTALHLAAKHSLMTMLTTIVDSGADPSIKNNKGETPGDIAIAYGHALEGRWLNMLISNK